MEIIHWYLGTMTNNSGFSYACCCDDGNQYVCEGSGIQITCTPGGQFKCESVYSGGNSDPNYNCRECCPGGPCA
ncbi:MAG: hypothetical protein V3V14_02680 [Saprospiraceae bacterium]